MKKFTNQIAVLGFVAAVVIASINLVQNASADAGSETVSGGINFADNSVTSAYELVMTVNKKIRHITCTNTAGSALFVSTSATDSSCSGAADNILMDEGPFGFALDNYPRPAYICVQALPGATISSGRIHCHGWWDAISK